MTDLLGLLQQVEERDKALGQSLRTLLESVAEMHAEDKATIRELEANARLGELVLGMKAGSRLDKGNRRYISVDCGPPLVYASILTPDPGIALQAIQEVGDDQG